MRFDVTPQDVLNAAATCQRTNMALQEQILKIRSYIQNLMGSYQGPAALQLLQTSEMWRLDADKLNTVLDTIAHNLQLNAHNYEQNESQALRAIQAVESVLGQAKL